MKLKKHVIDGNHTQTVSVTGNKGLWIVEESAKIAVESMGTMALYIGGGRSNTVRIEGDITSKWFRAVESHGVDTRIIVAATCDINPSGTGLGISLLGQNESLENFGRITGTTALSISGSGASASIVNNYLINGTNIGVYIDRAGVTLVNERHAVIHGNNVGIAAVNSTATDPATKFVNHGMIEGVDSWGFEGGDGREVLINDGQIYGGVRMAGGNDLANMVGTKGQVYVYGGYGDDVVVTDSVNVDLVEFSAAGNDTLKSYVSMTLRINVEILELLGKADINGTGNDGNNRISGNSGRNTLKGMDGDDTITGGAGNDIIDGGAGFDIFYFRRGDGRDTIQNIDSDYSGTGDFDTIQLSGFKGVKSVADAMDHAHKAGDDIVFKFGNDWLRVEDAPDNLQSLLYV